LPAADRLDKVTLLPRAGGVGGFARTMPDEEVLDSGLISKAYLQARMVVAMGGRAAELVVFGPSEITQGASGDLELVSRIGREMVTRYGFSPLGPQAFEAEGAEVFLGRDWLRSDPAYSQETGNRIDAQVQHLARTALDQAVALLTPRRPLIDALVEALIEQETIEGPAFSAIVERYEDQPLASAKADPASAEPDVEAAQVGL
ncbi:MAG: ATP-dependent zinc metalloprotease FtsH, partial [Cyanobacteriota bacterium]